MPWSGGVEEVEKAQKCGEEEEDRKKKVVAQRRAAGIKCGEKRRHKEIGVEMEEEEEINESVSRERRRRAVLEDDEETERAGVANREEAGRSAFSFAAAERLGASHNGKHKTFHELPVVRMLGLCVQVLDKHGIVIAHRNGHPLGPNRAWYGPPHLDDPLVEFPPGICHASLYRSCGPLCVFCRGSGTDIADPLR